MNYPGFWLSALQLSGKGVISAEVLFKKGLNVICGPSDTGKTFILQCIDFALGATKIPKEIPETLVYDTVTLKITTYSDNKSITIKRCFQGGDVEVSATDELPKKLKAKHCKNNKETLSNYLLSISGLSGKIIRKNQNGVKRNLTFRDIVRLCIIPEKDIIKDISPILSGQYSYAPAEKALFKFILTGLDDSAIIEREDKKTSKIRIQSQNDVIQKIIFNEKEEYNKLNIIGTDKELHEQLNVIEKNYNELSNSLNNAIKSISEIEEKRKEYWEKLKQTESRLSVLLELQTRFNILEEQYKSDIHRLDAIAETGARLSEMNSAYCAVCGSLSRYHDPEQQHALISLADISDSCAVESSKLQTLLTDLKTTQLDIEKEISEKENTKFFLNINIETINKELKNTLEPNLKVVLTRYHENQQKKERLIKAIDILDRLESLKKLRDDTSKESIEKYFVGANTTLPAEIIEEFSHEVESRLKAWNFPNIDHVSFSETDYDVIISNRRRGSHGKGVRAITHAAFSLSILSYCKSKKMSYPNFIIIDSPLVVYREPDPSDKKLSLDVKDAFYNDIGSSFADLQVVIIENEDPPQQLKDHTDFNIIRFSKTNNGRYGFIPTKK